MLYKEIPLPAEIKMNDICLIDVFHFVGFGYLNCVHYTIDSYSIFQWETALSLDNTDLVITHLLKVMATMDIPV